MEFMSKLKGYRFSIKALILGGRDRICMDIC